jgi:hypothetical protein
MQRVTRQIDPGAYGQSQLGGSAPVFPLPGEGIIQLFRRLPDKNALNVPA